MEQLQEAFERATALADVNPQESAKIYEQIIGQEDLTGDDIVAMKEKAIYNLGSLYVKSKNMEALKNLLVAIRPFFETISKAKTGKIIRTLIDKVGTIDGVESIVGIQIELCEDCINWCEKQERLFLRQQIEVRLAGYYLTNRNFQAALKLITKLVRDVKKVDDKHLLVEVHLIESRIQHSLRNIPKSKAALTAARAAANSIYIGPLLHAEIDMQSGALHSEEKDYKTAFSYFYEAFEGFDGLKDRRAPLALKYMLLSKIMNDMPGDVNAILTNKLAIKYISRDIDAMKEVALAYKERSLHKFEEVINHKYKTEIQNDIVIKNKLEELSDRLLEQNLQRLLEPFNKVEISHIAELIDLPVDVVQRKLSEMVLDSKFNGILDQGEGAIIVFDEPQESKTYQHALDTVSALNEVVNKLFQKSKELD